MSEKDLDPIQASQSGQEIRAGDVVRHRHEHTNRISRARLAMGGAILAVAGVAGHYIYDTIQDFRQFMESEDSERGDYSRIPGVGLAQDIVDAEEEPVDVEELLLGEAQSMGVSGMGVQPIEFTATQNIIARDMPSIRNRFFVTTGNLMPGVNMRMPDGNWGPIANAWTDVSGYTFAVSPRDGYELSIENNMTDPNNEHSLDVPDNPEDIVDTYTVDISVTDVHILDTLVQFPENDSDGRYGLAMLDGETGEFVDVQEGDTHTISDIENSWRSLLSVGLGTVDSLDTYRIAQEGTNIAKEELITGGHIGLVALAGACDMAGNLEDGLAAFVELQRSEGIIDDSTRLIFRTDVSEAMENFKNSLMASQMTNPDGTHGPVAPGDSLLSSRTFVDTVDDIPTTCTALDAQPEEVTALVASAREANNEAAVAALLARNGSSVSESVTVIPLVDLDVIPTEPIRAER